MTPELKRLWVEALRSGRYEQGRVTLRDQTNHFCCLGVLCDVVEPLGWASRNIMGWAWFDSLTVITDLGLESVGLTVGEQSMLVRLNDLEKRTFAEIADWVEANL